MRKQGSEEMDMPEGAYHEIGPIEPAQPAVYADIKTPIESQSPAGTDGKLNMWKKVVMVTVLFIGAVAISAFALAIVATFQKVRFICKLQIYGIVLRVRDD